MLLDGLKVILDNGWTVGPQEIAELLALCGLTVNNIEDIEFQKYV